MDTDEKATLWILKSSHDFKSIEIDCFLNKRLFSTTKYALKRLLSPFLYLGNVVNIGSGDLFLSSIEVEVPLGQS